MFETLPWLPPPPFDPDDTGSECPGADGPIWSERTTEEWAAQEGLSVRGAWAALRRLEEAGRARRLGLLSGWTLWEVRIDAR